MARLTEISVQHVEEMPENILPGILYVSDKYRTAIHLCACGCGEKTVTPLSGPEPWTYSENAGRATLRPSIGNFKKQNPYHAHYYVSCKFATASGITPEPV